MGRERARKPLPHHVCRGAGFTAFCYLPGIGRSVEGKDITMEYVLGFIIGTILSWVLIVLVVLIAQKLADLSVPPWPEALMKLGVIALGTNAVSVMLSPVNVWLSWIAGFGLFLALMVKWFDMDFFGAVVIVLISWVVRLYLVAALMGLISAAL